MKTKITILFLLLSLAVFSQQQQIQTKPVKKVINLKEHLQDSTAIVKAKKQGVDTCSVGEAVQMILALTNAQKALKDSLAKANIKINGIIVDKPDANSGMPSWISYILALAAIIIIWALSFIKSLSQSKILLLKRLGTEASNGIKKVQAFAGSLAALITALLAAAPPLPASIITDLNILEVICLTITLFSCFLVKDSSRLKDVAPHAVPVEEKTTESAGSDTATPLVVK